ncbi:uncharacterized protein LOC117176348 [Belonocnema kinseyi]|uniref:uncharacterized protein LOC117176348 n=1 Tax=Belonocnema kinseyi TaxID=2817044 RepID=UPI00143DC1A9|nr:uncharacterized protein LOC117176348 [Belonocnema kinseyi]
MITCKQRQRPKKERRQKTTQTLLNATKRETATKRRRTRPEAVLIKPTGNRNYADVLKQIRSTVKPEESNVIIKSIRKTRQGHVLLEVGASPEDKASFRTKLKEAIQGAGEVRQLSPKCQVEIRDLDISTECDEVKDALKAFLGEDWNDETKINMTKTDFRGSLKAFAVLNETAANKLDKAGHVRIGWVNCRVRIKAQVPRCYRCHGYGHIAVICREADRGNLCCKCGHEDHKSAAYNRPPKCILCEERKDGSELDHIPGSAACESYKDAARLYLKAIR